MQLTAEQFYEITEALGHTTFSASDDQRLSHRTPILAAVSIVPFVAGRAGEPATMLIHDLSAGGTALIAEKPMLPDARFFVQFSSREGHRPLAILCVVRHCRRVGTGRFMVGAQFLSWAEGTVGEVVERINVA